MTTEALSRAHRARPFRPFRLRMADGGEVSVPHPEFLAYNGTGRMAVVTDEGDGAEWVDLLLVVSLRFAGEPVAAPGQAPTN
jgi:hypothetical protein